MNVDVLIYCGVSSCLVLPDSCLEIIMPAWEHNLRYAYTVMVTCIGRRL